MSKPSPPFFSMSSCPRPKIDSIASNDEAASATRRHANLSLKSQEIHLFQRNNAKLKFALFID
ncbi:MAG TPA: hypothetical protein DCG26_05290 [Alphaproteobacteria bacterium]|nr:hypothetical protein [Alphaproteobacteria bacterium]